MQSPSLLRARHKSRLVRRKQVILFFFLPFIVFSFPPLWPDSEYFFTQFALCVDGNYQCGKFPPSLPVPHKTKPCESSIGVLALPELRYSRVCFIMVLGALQPDVSSPRENLRSAPIYQPPLPPAWGGADTLGPLPLYPRPLLSHQHHIIFKIYFELMVCVFFLCFVSPHGNVWTNHTQAFVALQMFLL